MHFVMTITFCKREVSIAIIVFFLFETEKEECQLYSLEKNKKTAQRLNKIKFGVIIAPCN